MEKIAGFLSAICTALALILAASPMMALAGERVTNPNPPVQQPSGKKHKTNFTIPLVIVGLGAGAIACILYCDDQPKDEPPPNPGPALKITPDNTSDKPIGVRLY